MGADELNEHKFDRKHTFSSSFKLLEIGEKISAESMLSIEFMFIQFVSCFQGGFFVFEFKETISLGHFNHLASFFIFGHFGGIFGGDRKTGLFLPGLSKFFLQFANLSSFWNIRNDNNIFNTISFSRSPSHEIWHQFLI